MEVADRLVVAMSREMARAPLVAVGLATTMPFVAAAIARKTNPKLKIVSVVGSALLEDLVVPRLPELEMEVLRAAKRVRSFTEAVEELLPKEQPLEFFRPGQIDAAGNTNNVKAAGRRLPGAAGIPDVTRYPHGRLFYYVPRHRKEVFVEKVEVVSGLGFPRPADAGPGPRRVYTDLGMLDFENGRMRLAAVYAGVTPQQVQEATGFPLALPTPIKRIPDPTDAERAALLVADPQGLRFLEVLPIAERWKRLHAIFG